MSRKFAILGHPLKHTMSPPIHQRLFEMSGRSDEEYLICDIAPEDLKKNLAMLGELDGYNITIPHKVAIIPYLDDLDRTARGFGAVNCVTRREGRSVGYNTDCYGFLRALEAGGMSLKDKKILQLGCGGVGRMMAVEAANQGASLTIAVREGFEYETVPVCEEIKRIAPECSVAITNLDKIHENFDLLVNATPVGMYPKSDLCPVADDVIAKCACVFEVIYNPVKTLLMKKAEEFGRKTIGGMAMLVWQAVVAHEIWDDAKYDEKDVAALIDEMEAVVARNFQ